MKAATDGGPAFPLAAHDDVAAGGSYHTQQGMSLRDWFAGQALMGWAAGRNRPMEHEACEPASVSRSCYAYADAMLRARERGVDVEDDESWFRAQLNACVYSRSDGSHEATIDYGALSWTAFGANRAAAIRALRAKVEGGAR